MNSFWTTLFTVPRYSIQLTYTLLIPVPLKPLRDHIALPGANVSFFVILFSSPLLPLFAHSPRRIPGYIWEADRVTKYQVYRSTTRNHLTLPFASAQVE